MNPFFKDAKKNVIEEKQEVKNESTSSMKIMVNIFYEPVDELKKILKDHEDIYFPILGGASRPDVFVSQWVKDNVQFDNSGENISAHNKLLNEMTSIYWVWKHYLEIGDPDYIGFNHYRRFFNLDDLKDRDDYDIICTNRVVEARTLYGAYQVYHKIEDLDMAMDIINKTNPEFFVDFHNAICGNTLFSCNMFLMKKELFFEYCSVIYPLLSRIAANINIEGRDNYQKRAVCFLAERITSAWIESQALNHGKRIKQVPIVFHSEWKNNNLNERGTYG